VSSYVYMKILESQPRRYERGIALLSLGQSEKMKKRLIADLVRPKTRLLDIGCGTGTAAILAARAGAHVTGFDVSAPMNRAKRLGCSTCSDVCPVGVFDGLDEDKKIRFIDQEACFACGACVKQCPGKALSVGAEVVAS